MVNKVRILVVEDDAAHRGMLKTMLKSWGYQVLEASDGDEAIDLVHEQACDLVLTDVLMERVNGIETLKGILSFNPALPVIIMTAYSSVETAVDSLRVGAWDYLSKPLDFELLKETIQNAIIKSQQSVGNREFLRQLSLSQTDPPILGRSKALKEMLDVIKTVAPTEANVLISGESGTGKELVAMALHKGSSRSQCPMVTVNCAALADNLLESELFGHERGAFTGADKRRDGRFVQANGGTIFLDEIGELPLALQAKLLRALQYGEVQRVGSDLPIKVDVRVFAATNKDLYKEVLEKRFREDLYFRLNVISIEVPPLRARMDDLPILAINFLKTFSTRNHKTIRGFAPQCLDCLLRHSWPGNVRELENAIERAVILCKGDLLTTENLPANIQNSREAINLPRPEAQIGGMPLDEMEKRAIEATLKQTGYNKSEAARILGITRATLHNKLRKYGIE